MCIFQEIQPFLEHELINLRKKKNLMFIKSTLYSKHFAKVFKEIQPVNPKGNQS